MESGQVKTEFDISNFTGKCNRHNKEPLLRPCARKQHQYFLNYQTKHSLLFLAINKSLFKYDQCVGTGGFGKVWKVYRKKSN